MSDGTTHQIWTVVIGTNPSDEGPKEEAKISHSIEEIEVEIEKPTLVMTHGFGSASCHFAPIIPELMKHFRIVLFDNLSFGCNPKDGVRLTDLTKCDLVDAWLVEYWEKFIEQS